MYRANIIFNWTFVAGLMIATAIRAQAADYTVLYSFKDGDDGAHPWAGLLADNAGNFYGTTWSGGGGGCGDHGCGTVFKLGQDGTEAVLYAFRGGTDGLNPRAGVIADKFGNLYGTTVAGGTSGLGTVFKLTPDSTETILHSFSGKGDGTGPEASLIADAAGNLYGTTIEGGSQNCPDSYGCGTVFRVAPDDTETVLYSFCIKRHCTDGLWPTDSLLLDQAGNLYGTTSEGGMANCENLGCGTVFKLNPDDKEKVLYKFCNVNGCGLGPGAGVIADASGNLYGTAGGGDPGYGIIYKVAPDGTETNLYSFLDWNGTGPVGEVIMDKQGNLYGTTELGGGSACADGFGCGVVFKLAPDGTETVLHAFQKEGKDGFAPKVGLIADKKGYLYGTTYSGGAYGYGTIFRVKE